MDHKFSRETQRRYDKVTAHEEVRSSFMFFESADMKKRAAAYKEWRELHGSSVAKYFLKHGEYRYDLRNLELVATARIDNGPMLLPDDFAKHYGMIPYVTAEKPLELI